MTGLRSPLPFTLSVTSVTLLTLAGCGSSPAVTPGGVPVAGTGLPTTPLAQALLDRTNEVRARGAVCRGVRFPAVPAVTYNARLERAAQGHADDMAARNYFSHVSLDGRTLTDRIVASGYAKSFVAVENLAAGYMTAAEVIAAWLASENGHCEALLDAEVREMGVGFQQASGKGYANYWVLDMGAQR